MNLSSINLRFFANIAPLISGLNKAERALDQAGRKMQATGKKLTFELTAPIAALGAVAVNTFQAFEQQMAEVKAVSGATGKEFQALETDAKRLGASTIFTAKEVGGLQAEFARLGFTADEITKVTEATLYLAQATGEDLGRSAEIAGSTLRAFGLDATQTTHVADVMAEAFNKSALDLNTFADSMKYVGPVAAVAGVSLEEASAMLAVLSNSGIKGSQAGTSLMPNLDRPRFGIGNHGRKNRKVGRQRYFDGKRDGRRRSYGSIRIDCIAARRRANRPAHEII